MQIDHCEVLGCCRSTTKTLEICADYGFDLQKLSQNIFTKQYSGPTSMEIITGNSVNKNWEKWNFGKHNHITVKVIHRLLQQLILPRFPLAAKSKYIFKRYLLFVCSCFRDKLFCGNQSILLDFSFFVDIHHTEN